ncbi:glycosyltransferase involved in cell wall biosynthesis [Flavobacterium sp. 28A]|uniref:glycosyltransferase family 4 protein n=1 Tax=Flavobacterium sp. 28A TaxID=2735895 RepID=UPI00156D8008|nr:glycosyltransferase family 4 protein [Flavobacterium sp. 28A]NRT15114.1 glycosyltransferase involved in cell wall biosynthesis [Flavobacterium sp. 28A]
MKRHKLIRITTVPISLKILLKGQLQFMSQYFEVIGVASSGPDLEQVKKEEGITVVPIEMSRKITPIKDLISVYQLYSLFKKTKPFIVHTHTPKAGIVGMLAAKLAKVPHRLHTVAGLPLMEAIGFKRKILDAVEKLTYACATKVYPNSKGLNDFIIEEKLTTPHKLKVIANGSSNGINTTLYSKNDLVMQRQTVLLNELNLATTDFVFIFVGRLVKDKGINELVAAFTKLALNYSNAKLLLVGPFEDELDPLSADTVAQIENNVNIINVGFQSDVRPYFALAHCLVFPSYREGFPNVVLQAGAMGLPSIVSNINGCDEIIIEGKNGIIIPVKSTQAIHDAMQRMISEVAFWQELKNNARAMIVSRYEQEVVWQAMLSEYKKLEENV